jgi:hypothetical protein
LIKFIGFILSALTAILVITNGNGSLFQNAFGDSDSDSTEDSVDEIVESAEEESDDVRDEAEDVADSLLDLSTIFQLLQQPLRPYQWLVLDSLYQSDEYDYI